MNTQKKTQSLLDLITEKNSLLNQYAEEHWQNISDVDVSPSEWNFLSQLYGKEKKTIASAARSSGISRQAAHKFYKNLKEKELLETESRNPRERYLTLTPLGIDCYEQYLSLERRMEQEIAATIGEDSFRLLKNILNKEWLSDLEQQQSAS